MESRGGADNFSTDDDNGLSSPSGKPLLTAKMGFWKPKEQLQYTEEDVSSIVSTKFGRLKELVGQDIYFTNNGVITQKQAQSEIDQKLKGNARSSIGLISSELELDRDVVKQLVNASNVDFYINGDNILPRGEISSLKLQLKDMVMEGKHDEQYIETIRACTKLNIDMKSLGWLVQQTQLDGLDLAIYDNNNLVISRSLYDSYQEKFISALNDLDAPVSLESIQVDEVPDGILKRIKNSSWVRSNSKQVMGSVDGKGIFTPQRHHELQKDKLLTTLREQGLVKLGSSQDAKALADNQQSGDVDIVNGYAVSKEYKVKLAENIKQDLEAYGFAATATEDDENSAIVGPLLVPLLTKFGRPVYNSKSEEKYFVTKSLTEKLYKRCREHFSNRVPVWASDAIATPKQRTKLLELLHDNEEDSSWKQFVEAHKLGLNESQFLDYSEDGIPHDVSRYCLNRYSSSLSSVISDINLQLAREIKQKVKNYQADHVSKIKVYALGLASIADDKKLYTKLASELIAYATEHLALGTINSLDDLNTALDQMLNADVPDVATTKAELVARLTEQMEVASDSDPALTLHLAVLIAHSRLPNNQGLLRATGKHVPKILKVLIGADVGADDDRYASFVKLKDAVISKDADAQAEYAAQVKRQIHSTYVI